VDYLTHKVYGWEVVVTNISSYKKSFQVLSQIPEGSIPLGNISYRIFKTLELESYSTTKFTYYFYFPDEGNFTQYPSNVSMLDKIVAVSKIQKFTVVHKLIKIPTNTFKDILRNRNLTAVYDFLSKSNLFEEKSEFSFDLIFWMLKDKNCFTEITKILRLRRIYAEQVWKFAFFHFDEQAIKGNNY